MALDVDWLKTKFCSLKNLTPIGSGGQKWVFGAEHPNEGSVVLKLIQPRMSIDLVTREMTAVQQVASSRVPEILEAGEIDSPLGKCFWFVERRILGSPVSDVLRLGPLSTPRLLRLALHVLQALAKSERQQIVHRDVKPANIMCDRHDGFWLLDFGLARHLQLSSLTPTADAFGKCTPGYAPPEQFRNLKRNIDSRTDLFALGVTLFECATGRNPFHHGARDALEILQRVETRPLPPLNLSFGAAHDFRDLVASMTQKRRDHRPRTAEEALAWIEAICLTENVS
jgi:serine/threonine-protein kinase